MELFSEISTVIEYIGIVAFSVSGAMIAIRRKTDFFGVLLLGIITSFGGGLTRDVIIGVTPPLMFSSKIELVISVVVSSIVFILAKLFSRHYLKNEAKIEHINDIFDALGLGVFVVIGAKVAIDNGYLNSPIIIISAGLLTGVCGGLLRDVLTMYVPFILVKRIYAVAAILGACVYYFLVRYGISDNISMVSGVAVTFSLRILAMTFKWNFPKAID